MLKSSYKFLEETDMDDFKPLFEYVEKNIENKMGLKELADFKDG